MPAALLIRQIADHVLNNPRFYPGPHQVPQPRTSHGAPQLDTHRQVLLIWDAMCSYVREHYTAGRAVHIPKLGTMTFEPVRLFNPKGKEAVYKRPCFVPTPEFQKLVYLSSTKSNGMEPLPGATCYSTRGKTVYLNYVPVAAGTYFKSDVVKSTLEAIFTAVIDLAKRDCSLYLDFVFAKMKVSNHRLTMQFNNEFVDIDKSLERQKLVKSQSLPKLSDSWRNPSFSKSMMNFVERPNSKEGFRMKQSTSALSIMSLDLNTVQSRSVAAR